MDRFSHITFASSLKPDIRLRREAWTEQFRAGQPQSADDFAGNPEAGEFLSWLFEAVGLDHRCYRPAPLSRRLPACLRSLRVSSLADARRVLEANPESLSVALDALLIGVTSFFRDRPVFADLATRVIPEILASNPGQIRVWSAGCSVGLELYSVGTLFADLGALRRCSFLGTDFRASAISRARRGYFDRSAVENVPDSFTHYFIPCNSGYAVSDEIRERTRFERADLLGSPPPGEFDLIFFRNVVVYLQSATSWTLWESVAAALRPGGVLVSGKSERPTAGSLYRIAPSTFRKREISSQ